MSVLIGRALALHSRKTPRKVAIVNSLTGEQRTYAELNARANRLANALLGAGLSPGTRVATWMHTSIAYVEVYLAAAKIGLVITPINEKFKADEVQFQLENSAAQVLIFSESFAPLAEDLMLDGGLMLAFCDGPTTIKGARSLDDICGEGSPSNPSVPEPGPDDLFMIAYTSGTTGFPKGALLTHASVSSIARMNALSYRLPIDTVGLYRGSMSFVATVCAFLMSHLYLGGTIVMTQSSDPDLIVNTIEKFGANYTSIPTPMLSDFGGALSRRPRALESLTSVLHSGSKAPADLLQELHGVVGSRLIEGWGMTEHSGGLLTATTPNDMRGKSDSARDVFESVGRAVPEVEVEVVDDHGRCVARDGAAVGEIVVRSPALATGYWADPASTAASFVDGSYRTGDLGSIDEAGYVYISERRSDLIVTGGINVYPSEVERFIVGMPGVADVAVVGLPHDRWGQTVVAAVVRSPGSVITEADVVDFCRRSMATYKKPTQVVFLEALPKTVSEKVTRQQVRLLLHPDARDGAGS